MSVHVNWASRCNWTSVSPDTVANSRGVAAQLVATSSLLVSLPLYTLSLSFRAAGQEKNNCLFHSASQFHAFVAEKPPFACRLASGAPVCVHRAMQTLANQMPEEAALSRGPKRKRRAQSNLNHANCKQAACQCLSLVSRNTNCSARDDRVLKWRNIAHQTLELFLTFAQLFPLFFPPTSTTRWPLSLLSS